MHWNGLEVTAIIQPYRSATWHNPPEGGYATDPDIVGIDCLEGFLEWLGDNIPNSVDTVRASGKLSEELAAQILSNFGRQITDLCAEEWEPDEPDPDDLRDMRLDR